MRALTSLIALLSIVMLPASAAGPAVIGTLRVGVAKVDITPVNLTDLNAMGGSFTGVHDHIYARVLVMDSGVSKAAIVALDLIEVDSMGPLRSRIQRELGIPADHIIICATHDHNAPAIGVIMPGTLLHVGSEPNSPAYTQLVYGRIMQALRQAETSLRPARFGVGKGRVDVNVNRDEFTLAHGWGLLGFNPRGPSDKSVWVIKFETSSGRLIAILFNYAVHSTVTLGTQQVSGDLAGEAERYVEQHYGDEVVALDTLGAAGDQEARVTGRSLLGRPISIYGGPPSAGGPPAGQLEEIRKLAYPAMKAEGLMLGAEVIRVADLVHRTTSAARIASEQRVFSCPVRAGIAGDPDVSQAHVASVPIGLSLIMLNQVAFVGVTGEVATEIDRHLMRATPLADTILITIANGRIGYIVDDAAYDASTHEVHGTPVARGCAEDGIVSGLTSMMQAHLMN